MRGWLEEYACGCTDIQKHKKDLLGYCKYHGDEAVNTYMLDDISEDEIGHDKDRLDREEE